MVFRAKSIDYNPAEHLHLEGGLGWAPDPSRICVLIHDFIYYYVDALGKEAAETVTRKSQVIINWAESHNVPVLKAFPFVSGCLEERGLAGKVWGAGPNSIEASAEVLPKLGGFRVSKRTFSAFYGTDLAVQIKRLGRSQILILGVFTSHGITATAFDAFANDIEPIIPIDATADLTPELQHEALRNLRRSTAELVTVDSLTSLS